MPFEPLPDEEEDDAGETQASIVITRLQQQLKALRSENAGLKKIAVAGEDFRASILGLEKQAEPVSFGKPEKSEPHAGTAFSMLSDLHWGENVSLDQMDGMNSYSLSIASARLERYFQTLAELSSKHWTGPKPERLILILGGDMVSGDIHLELQKTNSLTSLPQADDLVEHLTAGLRYLLKTLNCPIDVISVPGNHGRSSFKPEAKNAVEDSYDTLVSNRLRDRFHSEKRITFWAPASGDAYFSVYGWQILVTHGDKIGSRGGQGFVGPAQTIARGFKKLVMEYAANRRNIDYIFVGHFHTALQLEEGFANGCLVGPSEYSRMNRFNPRPATQLFLSIHPNGISSVRHIRVGHPSEGSLYQTPKPRYRVSAGRSEWQATSQPAST